MQFQDIVKAPLNSFDTIVHYGTSGVNTLTIYDINTKVKKVATLDKSFKSSCDSILFEGRIFSLGDNSFLKEV